MGASSQKTMGADGSFSKGQLSTDVIPNSHPVGGEPPITAVLWIGGIYKGAGDSEICDMYHNYCMLLYMHAQYVV